jgi:hypothetical protein
MELGIGSSLPKPALRAFTSSRPPRNDRYLLAGPLNRREADPEGVSWAASAKQ